MDILGFIKKYRWYFDIKYRWSKKLIKFVKILEKLLKNNIRSNNTYIVIDIWRNWYVNNIIYDIL